MYATSPRGKETVVDVIRVQPVIRVTTATYVRIVIRAIFAIGVIQLRSNRNKEGILWRFLMRRGS
jgi:hypothetical protein